MNAEKRLRLLPFFIVGLVVLSVIYTKWNQPETESTPAVTLTVPRTERQSPPNMSALPATTAPPTPTPIAEPTPEAEATPEVPVPSTKTLLGYVINGRTGEAVTDFEVSFLEHENSIRGEVSRIPDVPNAFRFDYPTTRGLYTAVIDSPDIPGSTWEIIHFRPNEDILEKTFTLNGLNTLAGTLVTYDTEEPIANATVSGSWSSGKGRDEITTTSNVDGTFLLEGAPAGWRYGMTMDITPEGGDLPFKGIFTPTADEVDDLGIIKVPRMGRLTVRVVDHLGEPVVGKDVVVQNLFTDLKGFENQISPLGNNRVSPFMSLLEVDNAGVTNQDGKVVYTSMYYPSRIFATIPNSAANKSYNWNEGEELDMTLLYGISNYTVDVQVDDQAPDISEHSTLYLRRGVDGPLTTALGLPVEGKNILRFSFENIAPGTYRRMGKIGSGMGSNTWGESFSFQIDDTITIADGDQREEMPLYSRKLRGKFIGNGTGYEKASLEIKHIRPEALIGYIGRFQSNTLVSAEGEFTIERFPHGRFELTAHVPNIGKIHQEFEVPPYPEPVPLLVIEVKEPEEKKDKGSVQFTLMDENTNSPITGEAKIVLRSATANDGTTRFKAENAGEPHVYIVRDLDPDIYEYSIETEHYGVYVPVNYPDPTKLVSVKAGERSEVVLPLKPKSGLIVQVEGVPASLKEDLVYTLTRLATMKKIEPLQSSEFGTVYANLDAGEYQLEVISGTTTLLVKDLTLEEKEVEYWKEIYTGF